MQKASERCLCFCYESEVLNDIYVCFMFADMMLVCQTRGDAHYTAWQRTGELCDAVVALGLHHGNRPDAETPFFLAELRKKSCKSGLYTGSRQRAPCSLALRPAVFRHASVYAQGFVASFSARGRRRALYNLARLR